MTYDNITEKINRYIRPRESMDSEECMWTNSSPILIDVPNAHYLNKLYSQYLVGGKIKNVSDYCDKDGLPNFAKLKIYLRISEDENEVVILHGLTPYLLLQGIDCLKKLLKELLETSFAGKLVILTVGCHKYISDFDQRLYDARRIVILDKDDDGNDFESERLPKLNFVSKKLVKEGSGHLNGLDELSKISLLQESGLKSINLITNKKKDDFPNSIYDITDFSSAYQLIKGKYSEFSVIEENVGTEEEWTELLKELDGKGDWREFITRTIGTPNDLSKFTDNLGDKLGDTDKFTRWIYYLALRTFGTSDNEYLSKVIQKGNTFEQFVSCMYDQILESSPTEPNFQKLYKERKKILEKMGKVDFSEQRNLFCKRISEKGKDAIQYLTDITREEKEKAIELICKYRNEYDESSLLSILKVVYPDLYKYLQPFDYGNDFLKQYFKQYKYNKVTNCITPAFQEMVDQQAKSHDILSWLQPRSVYVDALPKKSETTELYFVDAMGAEYLAYFQQKCYEKGLSIQVDVARCDLPSITSTNKTFVECFKQAQVKVYDNKQLDELKHNGQESYNYENNKLPIHIIEELGIIDGLVEQLKSKLDANQTAYVISDHGTSRLAVIRESENKWELKEKGEHSGRCCPKSDLQEEKLDVGIEENNFWSLANYDRFKGGRKASVEVHGGATIEEMAVPVIVVTKTNSIVKCEVKSNQPIPVSKLATTSMLLFVSINSNTLTISVNEEIFKAEKTGEDNYYKIEMPTITKEGEYTFTVYDKGNIIAQGLTFKTMNKGMRERNYF